MGTCRICGDGLALGRWPLSVRPLAELPGRRAIAGSSFGNHRRLEHGFAA